MYHHLIINIRAAQVLLLVASAQCLPSAAASSALATSQHSNPRLTQAANDVSSVTRKLQQASATPAKTFTAAASGRWSSKLTWAGAQVPPAGAHVGVPVGIHVLLDRQASVQNLTINGTLRCNSEASTSLTAASVTVYGLLECGTQEAPLDAAVSFTVTLTGKERHVLVGGWRAVLCGRVQLGR